MSLTKNNELKKKCAEKVLQFFSVTTLKRERGGGG